MWVLAITKSCQMAFTNRQKQCGLSAEKCIDYRREAGHLQAHGYRQILYETLRSKQSTIVAKSWKILKENRRHG